MFIFKKQYYYKNSLFKFVFVIAFLFLFPAPNSAQIRDSTLDSQKSIPPAKEKLPNKPIYHSPRKAALMSTIVPGLGQIYNKKYWKVPIIYAGIAGLAYSFNANQTKYIKYLTLYKYRIDGDPSTVANTSFSDDNLNLLQQYYHRYRNLSAIGLSLLYIMNIVDASVDAHMFTFDVSDDLSFHIHPTLINTASVNHYTTGLSLNISF